MKSSHGWTHETSDSQIQIKSSLCSCAIGEGTLFSLPYLKENLKPSSSRCFFTSKWLSLAPGRMNEAKSRSKMRLPCGAHVLSYISVRWSMVSVIWLDTEYVKLLHSDSALWSPASRSPVQDSSYHHSRLGHAWQAQWGQHLIPTTTQWCHCLHWHRTQLYADWTECLHSIRTCRHR